MLSKVEYILAWELLSEVRTYFYIFFKNAHENQVYSKTKYVP